METAKAKNYEGFTLIEMLIVMAIIILLIAIGAVGRQAAINRAARIQVQAGVKGFNEALTSFYGDNLSYPNQNTTLGGTAIGTIDLPELINNSGEAVLNDYIDTFEGGPETTYFYSNEGSPYQKSLVCASVGGISDEREQGFYCEGDGFNDSAMFGGLGGTLSVDNKEVEHGTAQDIWFSGQSCPLDNATWGCSNWSTDTKSFD